MSNQQSTDPTQHPSTDVKPIFHIVKDILHRVSTTLGNMQATQARLDAVHDKALHADFNEMLPLVQPHTKRIHEISCKMSCKCSGDGDENATDEAVAAVLKSLESYSSWYAKAVIALAAFALDCGKYVLVSQLRPKNPLATSVAILEQFPDIADTEKPKFCCKLINATLDVTKCIADFVELPSQYITPDGPEEWTTTEQYFPEAVEWTIRSIVACASQLMGHESASKAANDLSSLVDEGNKLQENFRKQLNPCKNHIDKKVDEAYKKLVDLVDEDGPLKILTDHNGKPLKLFHDKPEISIDELRGKTLFLVISDLDIVEKDLTVLIELYKQSREKEAESRPEIVWLPVEEVSTPEKERQFATLQKMMPWYSLCSLRSLDLRAIRYIKQVWQFKKLPLLAVVESSGKKLAQDPEDFDVIWTTWANYSLNEKKIWEKDTISSIRFLIGSFLEQTLTWHPEGKHICFYGGEDIEWIKKFTATARKAAEATNVRLEMLYVGNKDARKKVEESNAIIVNEKLSDTLAADLKRIQFFWLRLQSIWLSKEKHGKRMENNPVMQAVAAVLGFNSSNQGWAVVSKESFKDNEPFEVAKGKSDSILQCLEEYESWKHNVTKKGFVGALKKRLKGHHKMSKHCNQMILPMTTRSIDMVVTCVECDRPMKKFISYRCCDE